MPVARYVLQNMFCLLLWRSPSTDVRKGVNVPRLSSTVVLYSFFFSRLRAPAEFKIDSGVRCRCDCASVSMTFISNNASFDLESPNTSNAKIGPQPWTICFGVSLFDYWFTYNLTSSHIPKTVRTSLCHIHLVVIISQECAAEECGANFHTYG